MQPGEVNGWKRVRTWGWAWVATVATACVGEIEGLPDPVASGARVRLLHPAPASTHVRDVLGESGALVAPIELSAAVSGLVARVAFASAAGEPVAEITVVPGRDQVAAAAAEFSGDGGHEIEALGYDPWGRLVAADRVSFAVRPPAPESCHGWLDLYLLRYELGPAREGVADPVTVVAPINGVAYRYGLSAEARQTFFMDCKLALSLARAAFHLRRRQVTRVVDLGVYNYRCIGQGTPPSCPSGLSQHAYATAIDLAEFETVAGGTYSVQNDWIIDPDGEATCAAATETAKDGWLHDLICELKDAGIWNIVLTPNYNASHRNHFHVDLKDGANLIRALATRPTAIDLGPDEH